MLYCIEEFKSCNLELKFKKFGEVNSFPFLKTEYFDLLCMLKIIFEKNKVFKKIFIELIFSETSDNFFNIFWEYYRDSLFFSAYNFFHNPLWVHITHVFVHLSDFLLQITQDDL